MPDSDKSKRRSALTSEQSVVSRLINEATERQQASLTDGRGRPGHAGQKGIDKAGRSKATYNLPVERQNLVRQMAETEEISQGDIVEAAVVAFYNAWKDGQVTLEDLKGPTRSLKAMWKLAVPDDFTFFSE